MKIKLILSAAALLLIPVAGQAATFITYTDNAANPAYASGYAGNGAGTPGFGAFVVTTNTVAGGFAGSFTGTATATENGAVGAALDTSGKSFGMYANGFSSGTGNPSVTVSRSFNIPTQSTGLVNTGDIFSLDLITGYNDGAPGSAGVALTNGSGSVGSFAYQSNGANSGYYFNGAAIGQGYSNGILHLAYTLTAPNTFSFTSTGAVSYAGTFTSPTLVNGFQVQQINSANGGGDHDAFFNNLSLTAAPEPSQMAAISFMVLGLGGLLLKRRQARVI